MQFQLYLIFHMKKTITQTRSLLRLVLTFTIATLFIQEGYGQVTIGSNLTPNKDALLDLQQENSTEKGLLLPRVALKNTTLPDPMSAHVAGMTVYNTAKTQDVTPGYYYNNGSKWMKLFSAEDSFFYMPSIVLPTDQNDPAYDTALSQFSVDLYSRYAAQFTFTSSLPAGSNKVASSSEARLPVYESNELYYFVTYYDDTVFEEVKISSEGKLTYKLKTAFTYTDKTFMNVVFKVK